MNPPAPREGRLEVDGDHATLHFERRFHHPIEVVWEAITRPEHLARWAMSRATIEPRVGGQIEFWSGSAELHTTGRILAWEPPRLFEYESHTQPQREVPRGEHSLVRWELVAVDGTTLLRFTNARVTRGTAVRILPATHVLLDRLGAQLDGTALPEMGTRYGEVAHLYTR
jgi:uncharacterized protein YndB with AHSA1/START domain